MKLYPFSCLRPTPASAASLVTPPYEDLALADSRERARHAAGLDWPHAPEGEQARELRALLTAGTLARDGHPCLYVYHIEPAGGRGLTGLVACCAVDDYLDGTIRRHEQTRAELERTRAAHIEALGAQTGPVLLAHRTSEAVRAALGTACAAQAPQLDLTDGLGARNRVWRVDDARGQATLLAAYEGLACAYIADGHHRAAAAVDVALARRARRDAGTVGPGGDANPADPREDADEAETFLAALFDVHDFSLLSCNRVVRGGAARGARELLGRLRGAGLDVHALEGRPEAMRRGRAGLYADGAWYELGLDEGAPRARARSAGNDAGSPLDRLDATLLQRRVLGPVFGIADARRDERLAFVGGIYGLEGLERACAPEDAALALCPPAPDDVLAVADAGLVMPPKSTWFEPKPRGGLFARLI